MRVTPSMPAASGKLTTCKRPPRGIQEALVKGSGTHHGPRSRGQVTTSECLTSEQWPAGKDQIAIISQTAMMIAYPPTI